MSSLSEGRLAGRAPKELMALARWLLDEMDPAFMEGLCTAPPAVPANNPATNYPADSATEWPANSATTRPADPATEWPADLPTDSPTDVPTDLPDRGCADSSPDSSAASSAAISHQLLELAVQQEWLIRSIQAKRIATLAQAVKAMPPARRRRATKRRNNPINREAGTSQDKADHGQDADTDAAADTGARISSVRLTSARIAPEMTLHPRTATTLLEHAQGLVDDLPTIMALFAQARLDQARAIVVTRRLHQAAEEIENFEPGCDRWRMTEAMIASQAPGLTCRDLERLIDRLLLQLQPDAGTQAHEEARRSRHVRFEALADGMALITAMVPADIAQLLHGFLDAAADAARDRAQEEGAPDPRTHDQRCADALAALVQAVTNGMPIPLADDADAEAADTDTAATQTAATGEVTATTTYDVPASTSATSTRSQAESAEPADAESVSRPTSVHASIAKAWQQILALNGGNSRKTLLNVTITDASLLGLDNTPGLLHGHGPIAASLARRLGIKPAQVNFIILPGACAHPDAHNSHQPGSGEGVTSEELCPAGLDHSLPGIRRYRPGQALTNALTSLYPTCVFPGCTTPATRCDLDHLKPFGLGGMSCICNMRPACRPHHRLKTFGGWTARASRPDEPFPFGSTVWTTPDGTQHHTPPPCLPGMPGWSFPTTVSEPEPETLIRVDLMPSEERTARRTRRWKSSLDWWKNHMQKARREAQRRARQNPPPLRRPPHAPWGESQGRVAGLDDPPF
ncbi:HNH endonuclease signature motif containing protein [Kineosporia sp. NBRC 101677]|uniref:HNH endonuclease signature motif containing protein n=1 Tax=Kineosporia sp. NBRC 101677 TaxID=3032197 RepID=UPI00255402A3|nr:HNH endonuclease signature motif containing protein [Kineosporia sp. NBRC 101677]